MRQVSLPQTPSQDELQVATDREHARILASYGGLYEDARLTAMLERVADRLVAASERPDLRYKIVILNSPAINAFALPNGQLYVSRGLVALANDEAELASVLAHEMAHVIARHAAIREDQARQSVTIASVAEVLGDPQLGALALAKSKLALASFSRAQEFEADGIGVGIAARAGLDPYGAVRFLTAMQRNADLKANQNSEGDSRFRDFLSSHPATPDRVSNALANARQFSGPGAGGRSRAEYLSHLDGLVYGEDPNEGFVRGRRFIHPKLAFTFLAPPGFGLENTAQAVLGIKDGGGQALRLDVVPVPAEQSLGDYLRSGWIENVDPRSIEQFTVNGFPAAGAVATGEQWAFHLYALRYGSDVYRFIFASKQRSLESDRAFREAVSSFRRMSLKEAREVRPLRIKIVTVKTGDTVQSLTHRMAAVDKPAERLRILNGLGAHEQPKPGEQIKLLVE
ncbi:MAG: M48 family metalloprotease [Pseudolabrys sp.]|nr:M48 family metalloprotease [Pseudolabrys sp.]MBV9954974.1 M48 family metalloprotease [Pseudolabrys sp.]